MSGRFQLKTEGGYPLDEVVSSLQKTIRRGLEKEALFWSMELLPHYERYLWRRLKIISNEDIGIANPGIVVQIQTLCDQYFELRERGDMGCVLMVANAILFMCRSDKTRLADHFICMMIQEREQGILRLEVPDFALDFHTRRGRAQGRGLRHFMKEGAQLSGAPRNKMRDPYYGRSYELEGSPEAKKLKWKKLCRKGKEEDTQVSLFE